MSAAGANVRLVRQQVGMSLRAVADAADMEPATLSRIETGKQKLTEDIAKKLARVMHVSTGIFFSDAGVVETAMLRMRKAPLLTATQLLTWTGPEGFDELADQVYFHTSIQNCSRYVFAYLVIDTANTPEVKAGDLLLFDARREPKFGDLVLAQSESGHVEIGNYRPSASISADGVFTVVPAHRLHPEAVSDASGLLLRGVCCEQRRNF